MIGATTGNVNDAVNAGETAKVAVENNSFDPVFKELNVLKPSSWGNVLDSKNYSYQQFENDVQNCAKKNTDCSSVLKKYWEQHESNLIKLKKGCSTGNETLCQLWAINVSDQLANAKNIKDPQLREFYTIALIEDLAYLNSKITLTGKVKANLLLVGYGGGLSSISRGTVTSHLKAAGISSATSAGIDALSQKIVNGKVNYEDVVASGIVGGFVGSTVGKPNSYSTSTTQAAQRAASNHPLLADAIPRNGSRLIVNQGPCPTCGPNLAKMVLDTLGKNVSADTLISQSNMTSKGINYFAVRDLLKKQGVDAIALPNRTVNDLSRYTASGNPTIVRITGTNGFSHFVVVDGITTRNGQQVVAIRDPQNMQYFSPISTFKKSFTGEAVIVRSK